ncbi:MAG TPA: alpha/beta fold hydrolase [Pirellulaceae bacterium]|nr:alpha/beta fold hydrolase [Pirellulaceae bacterium]
MPSFAAEGFTQNYRDAGQGVPIVAVHAFPLDGAMWRYQVEALHEVARWIVPDLQGFGGSVSTEEVRGGNSLPPARTPALFADDLARLLDHAEVDRAVLCGASMGGYVAFEFERRHRDRLLGLILCGTRADADSSAKISDRRKLAEETMERGSQVVADAFSPKLLAKQTRDAQWHKEAEIVKTLRRQDPTAIAAASLGLGQRADMTSRLGAIDVPALVVSGEEDLLTPPDVMRVMADAIPGAEFASIPDAGHLAPFEQPDPVNAAIRRFLNERFPGVRTPRPPFDRPGQP